MDKLPFEALEQMLADAKKQVPIGSHWRHYKGNTYRVDMLALNEEDCSVLVIYTPLEHSGITFARSLNVWLENVTIDGETQPRFAHLSE